MKLLLAPMATICHRAFRTLADTLNDNACDEYYTEMISAAALVTKGQYESYYIDNHPKPQKTVYQIVGSDIDLMNKAARLLSRFEPLGIDVNMGCCAPEIYKKGAGVFWMSDKKKAKELLTKIKSTLKEVEEERGGHIRLSVKCRLTDKRTIGDFSERDFLDFLATLIESGVEQITIHPRCRRDKYKDPLYVRHIKSALDAFSSDVKIVANGNIKDLSDIEWWIGECGKLDTFMIGRAAVTKPWIFKAIREEVQSGKREDGKGVDLASIGVQFCEYVQEYLPKDFYKSRLKRFFYYYSDNYFFSHQMQTKFINTINNSKDIINDLIKVLKDYGNAKC